MAFYSVEVLAHNADIIVGTRKQETVAKSVTVLCNPSTFPVITGRNVFTRFQFSKLKGTQVRQSEMRSVVVPSRSPSKPIRSLKRKQIKIQNPTIFYQRKFRSLYFRVTDSCDVTANGCHSNGCLLVVQKKSCKTSFSLEFHCPKIGPFPACHQKPPPWPSPGAGPFDCQEPQILGQSCRAPCDSGAEFAVITCEEQGWTLQDECPTESYLLDAGIYLGL